MLYISTAWLCLKQNRKSLPSLKMFSSYSRLKITESLRAPHTFVFSITSATNSVGRGNSAANVFMMPFNRETSPPSVNTDKVTLASVFTAKCFNLTSTEVHPSIVHNAFTSMAQPKLSLVYLCNHGREYSKLILIRKGCSSTTSTSSSAVGDRSVSIGIISLKSTEITEFISSVHSYCFFSEGKDTYSSSCSV